MARSKSRLINLLALLVIVTSLSVASMSALGFFDPLRLGTPVWGGEQDTVQIGGVSTVRRWLDYAQVDIPSNVRITAGRRSGESDIGYGLLLGQDDSSLAVAVSPLGYVTIWQEDNDQSASPQIQLLPWQPWPHVLGGEGVNEIMATMENDRITVRINREWLWEGDLSEPVDKIGVFGVSYGDKATVNFQQIEVFTG